jgi:hypothetical protein
VSPKVRSSQLESQVTIFLSFIGSNKCLTYWSNEGLVYTLNSGEGFGISHWIWNCSQGVSFLWIGYNW